MRFFCILNPLVQENVTLYCPLWWQPWLCSLSLLFFTITSSYNAQFSLTLNDLTLLEAILIALLCTDDNLLEGPYSIHRQVWWTLKQDLGLRVLDAQVVSLLSAEFLASKDKGKHHILKDLLLYKFYVNMKKHKSLRCLPCPTPTILAYNILMGAHNHKRFLG